MLFLIDDEAGRSTYDAWEQRKKGTGEIEVGREFEKAIKH